jgi:prepilin-type N-terminal cleavage/methylation domain-containing protein
MEHIKARFAAARKNEEGFTLIELAVVILIIGILLALALPAFLGVQKTAKYKTAQAALHTTAVNAAAQYTDAQSYATVNAASLALAEPTKTYSDAVLGSGAAWSANANSIVEFGAGNQFAAVAFAQDRCYLTVDDKESNPSVSGNYYIAVSSATLCQLPGALTTAGLSAYTPVVG